MTKVKYKNLLVERTLKGYSQRQIGKLIGLSLHGYRGKEIGESDFTVDQAKKLMQIYNKSFDELFQT